MARGARPPRGGRVSHRTGTERPVPREPPPRADTEPDPRIKSDSKRPEVDFHGATTRDVGPRGVDRERNCHGQSDGRSRPRRIPERLDKSLTSGHQFTDLPSSRGVKRRLTSLNRDSSVMDQRHGRPFHERSHSDTEFEATASFDGPTSKHPLRVCHVKSYGVEAFVQRPDTSSI